MVSALETTNGKREQGAYDGNLSAPPSVVTVRTLFIHPSTHPIILDLIALKKYGAEWLEWEAETIQESIQKDYGNISDLNFSKLMAMKTLHIADGFWKRWEVFVWCTMPLNGIFPDFEMMQVPTVAQCAVAVEIADHTRRDVTWSEEVRKYLEIVHVNDGLYIPQTPLEMLVQITSGWPSGVNLNDVRSRWPDVRRTLLAPAGETDDDEQLRRMLSVFEHLEESRSRLKTQLTLVQDA
jgi:hypothetical protein